MNKDVDEYGMFDDDLMKIDFDAIPELSTPAPTVSTNPYADFPLGYPSTSATSSFYGSRTNSSVFGNVSISTTSRTRYDALENALMPSGPSMEIRRNVAYARMAAPTRETKVVCKDGSSNKRNKG